MHAYDNSATAGFSVGGLANKNSEILLDGSPDTASDNSPAYSPPVDATSEVKLNIFESDATYGHAAGGVANIVTKSGSNNYHGSAFEYNQISALNANNYFNRASRRAQDGLPLQPVRRNHRRRNPHSASVYNGTDKLFGFFGYEGIRTTTPASITTFTVPTDAERKGDFSALLALGSQYQIYNPYYRYAGQWRRDPSTLWQAITIPGESRWPRQLLSFLPGAEHRHPHRREQLRQPDQRHRSLR